MMIKKMMALLLCSNMAYAQTDSLRMAHIGLVYPLSTNGKDARQFTNYGSFHPLAGVSGGEKSFCLSGVANVVVHNANGFIMAGVINHIGGNSKGMQMAGLSNIAGGTVQGFQMAGFNNVARNANGAQMAGFSNIVKDTAKGVQMAGFNNIARVSGTQAAGFANISKRTKGAQLAGFANISKSVRGAQLAGFTNIAAEVDGVQASGFINIAKKVKGVQVAGFINIADSCDYPIGLINIIKNGEQYMGLSIDESATMMASLRSGSKKMYGILGVGINPVHDELRYGLEGGIGMHIPLSPSFRFKTEFTVLSLTDFTNGVFMKSSLRILPSLKMGSSFEAFAGPSFGFSNYPLELGDELNLQYVWSRRSKGTFYGLNIGAMAGIQVRL
jgi:hypothetical protein